MKKIYALGFLMLAVVSTWAQIKIIEPGSSTDVNGQTLEVTDLPSASDMEVDFYVINTSGSSLTMVCTRYEVDGLSGTQNSTCWQICPEILNTGAKPTYTVNISGTNLEETAAAGDTITSFAGHYYPEGLDGCSLFKYEWKDATTGTVYGHVYVRFIHMTSGTCTASTGEEMALNFEVYPNPADQNINIQLDESSSKEINVSIVDVLGKVVSTSTLGAGTIATSIATQNLMNGVYFVTFATDSKTLLTKKIVVRH